MWKELLAISALLSPTVALADTYVRCEYDLPKSGHQSFIEEEKFSHTWLKMMKDDKSIPNWDDHAKCSPLDSKMPIYVLVTIAHNGTVSVKDQLTENMCQTIANELVHEPYCPNGCFVQSQDSDIESAKC